MLASSVASQFNVLMHEVTKHLKVIESVLALNPAFVAKVALAVTGARRSRNEANAQHMAIAGALTQAFPDEFERAAVVNWFIFVAKVEGYYRAHRQLTAYALAGGDPMVGRPLPAPLPALPVAAMPGFRIGPWKSPARNRALKEVAALGNRYGAGHVFKAALETYYHACRVLDLACEFDGEEVRTVRTVVDDPAIELVIEGADESLLDLDLKSKDKDARGVTVRATLVDDWRPRIEAFLRHKVVRPTSLQYWQLTLEDLGIYDELIDD